MSVGANYSSSSTELNQQIIEKRKNDRLEQVKELASLTLMLEDVIKVVASSQTPNEESIPIKNESLSTEDNLSVSTLATSAPSSSNTATTKTNYPKSTEVADALVCMSEMVSQLELQIQNSTNESYILATEIMITQINAEMAAMNEYIQEYNKAVNDINSYFYWAYDQTGAAENAQYIIDTQNSQIYHIYQNAIKICSALGLPPPPPPTYISYDSDFYVDPFAPYYDYGSTTVNGDVQNQINYYMSRTKTITDYYIGKDGNYYSTTTVVSDPDYKGLEKYIQAHCPCPITFPADCTDPNEMLRIAGEQVQAYGCSEAQQATDNLESSLLLSSSPIGRAIGHMIFSNMEFSEQMIKDLQQLVNSTINAITLISTLNSTSNSDGPSSSLFIQILSIMTNAISEMEALINACENKLTKNNSEISEKFTEQSKKSLEIIREKTDELTKLLKEEEESEKLAKTVGIITDSLMILMAVLTGNIGLIVCAAVMCALDQTGVLEKLQNKIAVSIEKDLEKNGKSKEKAEKDSKAIAAGVVIGIVIAGSLLSMEGAEMAASFLAEDSEVIATSELDTIIASEKAGIEASASTAKSAITSILEKLEKTINSSKIFSGNLFVRSGEEAAAKKGMDSSQEIGLNASQEELSEGSSEIEMTSRAKSTKLNEMTDTTTPIEEVSATKNTNYFSNNQIMAITNGLQVVGSTNLAGYATEANLDGKKSKEQIAKESRTNSIIVDASAMVASLGLMSSMSEIKASELFTSSKLSKMFKESIDTKHIVNGLNTIGLGATVIQSANEFHRGLILKKQADAELELGLGKATLSFFNYIQDIANQLLQSTTKEYRDLLNARGQTDTAMLKNMLIFEAEYAKLLAQSA